LCVEISLTTPHPLHRPFDLDTTLLSLLPIYTTHKMASHLEVRAAYQDWCLANPLQPMDQFEDYARLAEVADVEPVDMVSEPRGL
jgi:hypothetical protein